MYSLLQDGEEVRTAINNKLPAKIDIGPVYNVDPKHRNAYAGQFRDATSNSPTHLRCYVYNLTQG